MTSSHDQHVTWTFYQYDDGHLHPFKCTFPAQYSTEPDDKRNVSNLLEAVGYCNMGSLGDYVANSSLWVQYFARRRGEQVSGEYRAGQDWTTLPYTWCVEIIWGRDVDRSCERVEYVFIHDMADLIPFLNSLVPLITCSFQSEHAINQTMRKFDRKSRPYSVYIGASTSESSTNAKDSASE